MAKKNQNWRNVLKGKTLETMKLVETHLRVDKADSLFRYAKKKLTEATDINIFIETTWFTHCTTVTMFSKSPPSLTFPFDVSDIVKMAMAKELGVPLDKVPSFIAVASRFEELTEESHYQFARILPTWDWKFQGIEKFTCGYMSCVTGRTLLGMLYFFNKMIQLHHFYVKDIDIYLLLLMVVAEVNQLGLMVITKTLDDVVVPWLGVKNQWTFRNSSTKSKKVLSVEIDASWSTDQFHPIYRLSDGELMYRKHQVPTLLPLSHRCESISRSKELQKQLEEVTKLDVIDNASVYESIGVLLDGISEQRECKVSYSTFKRVDCTADGSCLLAAIYNSEANLSGLGEQKRSPSYDEMPLFKAYKYLLWPLLFWYQIWDAEGVADSGLTLEIISLAFRLMDMRKDHTGEVFEHMKKFKFSFPFRRDGDLPDLKNPSATNKFAKLGEENLFNYLLWWEKNVKFPKGWTDLKVIIPISHFLDRNIFCWTADRATGAYNLGIAARSNSDLAMSYHLLYDNCLLSRNDTMGSWEGPDNSNHYECLNLQPGADISAQLISDSNQIEMDDIIMGYYPFWEGSPENVMKFAFFVRDLMTLDDKKVSLEFANRAGISESSALIQDDSCSSAYVYSYSGNAIINFPCDYTNGPRDHSIARFLCNTVFRNGRRVDLDGYSPISWFIFVEYLLPKFRWNMSEAETDTHWTWTYGEEFFEVVDQIWPPDCCKYSDDHFFTKFEIFGELIRSTLETCAVDFNLCSLVCKNGTISAVKDSVVGFLALLDQQLDFRHKQLENAIVERNGKKYIFYGPLSLTNWAQDKTSVMVNEDNVTIDSQIELPSGTAVCISPPFTPCQWSRKRTNQQINELGVSSKLSSANKCERLLDSIEVKLIDSIEEELVDYSPMSEEDV